MRTALSTAALVALGVGLASVPAQAADIFGPPPAYGAAPPTAYRPAPPPVAYVTPPSTVPRRSWPTARRPG